MFPIIAIATVLIVFGTVIWLWLRSRAKATEKMIEEIVRTSAEAIAQGWKAIELPAYEFRRTEASEFDKIDQQVLNKATDDLQSNGFVLIGDLEDLTSKKFDPSTQGVQRMLTSADGTMLATVGAGYKEINGEGKYINFIGIQTEFNDGKVIGTSNLQLMPWTEPDWNESTYLPPTATATEIAIVHRAKHAARLQSHPEAACFPTRSIGDAVAFINRLQGRNAEFRKTLSLEALQEEIKKLSPPDMNECLLSAIAITAFGLRLQNTSQ